MSERGLPCAWEQYRRAIEAKRDRMRCHRDGDTCAWAGCPNQFDDRPSTGCFLVGARKGDA